MTTVTEQSTIFYDGPSMCDDYAQGTIEIKNVVHTVLRKLHSIGNTTVYHLLGIDCYGQKWLVAHIFQTPQATICHPFVGRSKEFTCDHPIDAQVQVAATLLEFQADYEQIMSN